VSQPLPAIEFQNVTFAYNGGVPVLEDASFTIEPQETLSIVGPNGGGKTTLLKLALGLLTPNAGQVSIFGQSPEQARQRIGYMPQFLQYDPLFPASALEVVLMGRIGNIRWGGFYKKADREKALACLEEVRLADKAKRPLAELSGGERQRVLIARALAAEPDILLLDEPTASVDMAAEEQLFETLEQLHHRITLIMVSHDIAFVSRIVRRVLCVHRHVHTHSTEELKDTDLHHLYGHGVRAVRHDTEL